MLKILLFDFAISPYCSVILKQKNQLQIPIFSLSAFVKDGFNILKEQSELLFQKTPINKFHNFLAKCLHVSCHFYQKSSLKRQNCTTPPNHWDFGIWLGWMSISWDPSQLHAIPNPDHPPLRICLTYQLFCTKKKCPWAFKSSDNIEIRLKVSKFSSSLFWSRFSSGQSRTLIQGRGTREETHYKKRLKTAAGHHFKRHWIHWGELI